MGKSGRANMTVGDRRREKLLSQYDGGYVPVMDISCKYTAGQAKRGYIIAGCEDCGAQFLRIRGSCFDEGKYERKPIGFEVVCDGCESVGSWAPSRWESIISWNMIEDVSPIVFSWWRVNPMVLEKRFISEVTGFDGSHFVTRSFRDREEEASFSYQFSDLDREKLESLVALRDRNGFNTFLDMSGLVFYIVDSIYDNGEREDDPRNFDY